MAALLPLFHTGPLLMASAQLPKLSLDVLRPALGAGLPSTGCPAFLSLANLELCCATRSQVNQLAPAAGAAEGLGAGPR